MKATEMADKSTPPDASAPAPPSAATTTATPAGSTGKVRSGLTGHLLPSFWRRGGTAAGTGDSDASALSTPSAAETSMPALPASVSRGRWWPNRIKHGESVGRATLLIMLCAVLSLGIYLYGTLRFPLAAHLTPPPLDIGKLTS